MRKLRLLKVNPYRLLSSTAGSALQSNQTTTRGKVFFDNVYPLKIFKYDPRMLWVKFSGYSQKIELKAPNYLLPTDSGLLANVKCESNLKEGGLFMEFDYPKEQSLNEIVQRVKKHLQEANIRSSFNLQPLKVHEVKGEPFLEDMNAYLPSRRLKVEFEGPDLHVEELYKEFRKFGRIINIIPQSSTSKELPRFSIVHFQRTRDASSARNCLHGEIINKTRISVNYEPVFDETWFWNFISGHPRISVPVILALLAGTIFLVFDPVRVFFVQHNLEEHMSFSTIKGKIQKWLLGFSAISPYFTVGIKKDVEWQEVLEEKQRLTGMLKETPHTVILVAGPKGSGKSVLTSEATKNRKYKLQINLDEMADMPDLSLLSKLSEQVGFYPQLNFLVTFGALIDSITTSLSGTKSGFAVNTKDQIKKILETMTMACTKISIQERIELEKWHNRDTSRDDPNNLPVPPELDYPVFIIKGFMDKERVKNEYIYQMFAEWAASLTEKQLGHVIFVTANGNTARSLNTTLGNRAAETFHLEDIAFDHALNYVKKRLGVVQLDEILKDCVAKLGGRMTDLDLFIQKIKASPTSTIKDSFYDILSQTIAEVRKLGLSEIQSNASIGWTTPQMWKIVELLSKYPEVPFEELRHHALFNGDATALNEMDNRGFISVVRSSGGEKMVKPGRPIYRLVFSELLRDEKLNAVMNITTYKDLIRTNEAKMKTIEQELSVLTSIAASGYGKSDLIGRIEFLTNVFGETSKKCVAYEKEIMKLKKVIRLVE